MELSSQTEMLQLFLFSGSGAMGYNPPAAPTGPTGEYPGAYPNLDGSMNSSEYHDPTDEETDLYEVDDYDSTPTSREPTPARSESPVSLSLKSKKKFDLKKLTNQQRMA